jgi:urease accessory protein
MSDSGLPMGRFVHSHGLEAWARDHPDAGPTELSQLIEGVVSQSFATLDGAIVAHAHRAASLDTLLALDRKLSARKLTPSARAASQTCGRQLAALATQLVPKDGLVTMFALQVTDALTDGNLAVIEGTLARALHLSTREAVLVDLRGTAAALASAAVRLALVQPTRAQIMLSELAPALSGAAETALSLGLDELSATTPQLEVYALRHLRNEARMFQS